MGARLSWGAFFRLDEIQQWKQRAGEFGNCDPPPGQKETAVPEGAKHDGISVDLQEKHILADANIQGTPCQKCQWLYDGQVRARGRWWFACSLTAMLSLDRDIAETLAEATLCDACEGEPVPPFTTVREEARDWATFASPGELKAYLAAIWNRLPDSERDSFLSATGSNRRAAA